MYRSGIPPGTLGVIFIKIYDSTVQYFVKFSNADRKNLVARLLWPSIIDSCSHRLLGRFFNN